MTFSSPAKGAVPLPIAWGGRRVAKLGQAVQFSAMPGHIASLYRYPVKGFTPERLEHAELKTGAYFPCDRVYAVENGPSGFDPAAPTFVSKGRFTVLARIPRVALVRTAYEEASGVLTVTAEGCASFAGDLQGEAGRTAFAAWLTDFLGPEEVNGPLKVLCAPPHRFTDDIRGFVSVINLASVRDLEEKLGKTLDPLRFRGNIQVEGWPAWSELEFAPGAEVRLGGVRAAVHKPITRCIATHVDPLTGERDIDLIPALRDLYGHLYCGIYLNVTGGGRVQDGDPAELS